MNEKPHCKKALCVLFIYGEQPIGGNTFGGESGGDRYSHTLLVNVSKHHIKQFGNIQQYLSNTYTYLTSIPLAGIY